MISRRKNTRHNRGRISANTGGGTAPPYSPLQEGNCVFLFEADDVGVSTTSATISDPSDFSAGTWTKTGVTVTANSDGIRDLLTSTLATATTAQAPGNAATNQAITFTVDVKRVASDFVYIETTASAAGRTWFNINAGTTGTTGANHSGVSITTLGGGEWRITLTASSHTTFALCHADADNVTTNTPGHSFLASAATVAQTRMSAFNNLASAVNWAQATANSQPRIVANTFGSRPGAVFSGGQIIMSTEAAVATALNGDDHAFTFVTAHKRVNTATQVYFGMARAASSALGKFLFGQHVSGSNYAVLKNDDAAVSPIALAPPAGDTNTHHLMIRSSDGVNCFGALDGAAETSATLAPAAGVTTSDRAGFGGRAQASVDLFATASFGMLAVYSVGLDAAALARLRAYNQTKWGTP